MPMKAYLWGGGTLHIFLTSALEGGANFTPRPLYSQYALNRRLVGPHSRSGRFRKVPWTGNRTPNLPVCKPSHYTGCATSVSISLYGHFLTLPLSPRLFHLFPLFIQYYLLLLLYPMFCCLPVQRPKVTALLCDLSRSTCHSAWCHF
jgi:hypothetical protein